MESLVKCPVFGRCGGCQFQDMRYEMQTEQKKRELLDSLTRAKLPAPEDIKVFIKEPYYYRNRMDFVISEGGPGFRQKGKFARIVNFEQCAISNNGINAALQGVRGWFEKNKGRISVFDVVKRQGCLRYSVIRSSYFTKETSVTFIFNKDYTDDLAGMRQLVFEFADSSDAKNVLIGYVKHNTDQSATPDYEIIKGSDILTERLGPYTYEYHTQGFFQNNPMMLMDMLMYVRENTQPGWDVLVDLFGGVGTFGIFLNDKAREILVVDNSKEGIKCAVNNIAAAGIKNALAYEMDAAEMDILGERLRGKRAMFVLDPPRAGLHKKTVRFIKSVKPAGMIYVSCNPQQLAQDLDVLRDYYTIKDIALFDMFPQTRHMESIAVLTPVF